MEFGWGGYTTPKMNNAAEDFLFGTESSMNPYNQDSLNAILEMVKGKNGIEKNKGFRGGSNFLEELFGNNPEFWQRFEQPYLNNFNENIAPGIAERFAGMGTGGGALSSSGLQNSLAQAGRGLQSDLAAMRGNMQMQGLNANLAYAQQPYTNKLNAAQAVPGQYYETPGQAGFFQGAAQGAGNAITNFFGL